MSRPWTMIGPNGQPGPVSMDFLLAVITDVQSWHNFLVMLYTGEPAEMRIQDDGGKVESLKVIKTELLGSRPTYDEPRRN